MKLRLAFLAVIALGNPQISRAEDLFETGRGHAAAQGLADRSLEAFHPAYRLIEALSDGVFSLLQATPASELWVKARSRALIELAAADSFPVFKRELLDQESRLISRLYQKQALNEPSQNLSAEALREQRGMIGKSLTATFVDRYQIKTLERWIQSRGLDLGELNPSSLAAGSAAGGVLLYMNGFHAHRRLGTLKIGVDLAPLHRLRAALQEGGSISQAAGVDLACLDGAVSLRVDWSVNQGRWRRENYELKYQTRF